MAQHGIVTSSADDSKSDLVLYSELFIEVNFYPGYESSLFTETSTGPLNPEKELRDPQHSGYLWFVRAPYWITSRVLEISGISHDGKRGARSGSHCTAVLSPSTRSIASSGSPSSYHERRVPQPLAVYTKRSSITTVQTCVRQEGGNRPLIPNRMS
jgi:hypothetical protein